MLSGALILGENMTRFMKSPMMIMISTSLGPPYYQKRLQRFRSYPLVSRFVVYQLSLVVLYLPILLLTVVVRLLRLL